jgi:hypothetical protein
MSEPPSPNPDSPFPPALANLLRQLEREGVVIHKNTQTGWLTLQCQLPFSPIGSPSPPVEPPPENVPDRRVEDILFLGRGVSGRLGERESDVEKLTRAGLPVLATPTQVVTGLVLNDRPGVPRRVVRRLRAVLHRARTEGLEAQNREGRPDFRAWLRGMIAYVGMARPEMGSRLLAELESLP